MNKLLKNLWRGRKQGRCGRSPMLKIEKYAHIYLVFAHAREFQKVCPYRNAWQTVYMGLLSWICTFGSTLPRGMMGDSILRHDDC